uniref:Uncharacterized protein n=1 Tax=Rhizophora mucronata TaxID=61149 RepID=A0A2P2MD39_RHIMU
MKVGIHLMILFHKSLGHSNSDGFTLFMG